MEQLNSEPEQQECNVGSKQGLVDFDTLRVIQEAGERVAHGGDETKKITFSPENMHAGIIAAVIAETIHRFQDYNIDALTVSEKTLGILDLLGIPYEEVDSPHEVIFAAEKFIPSSMNQRQTGD